MAETLGKVQTADRTMSDLHCFWSSFSSSSAELSLLAMCTRASLSGERTTSNCLTNRLMAANRRSLSPTSCSEPSSDMPLSDQEPSVNSSGIVQPWKKTSRILFEKRFRWEEIDWNDSGTFSGYRFFHEKSSIAWPKQVSKKSSGLCTTASLCWIRILNIVAGIKRYM